MTEEQLEAQVRKERRRAGKREKSGLRIAAALAAVLLIGAAAFLLGRGGVLRRQVTAECSAEPAAYAARIDVIDVGQGLEVLIESDGEFLLIDGGGREASSKTVSFLKERGVTKLDYLLLTHYDADHINGAVGAFAAFGAESVLGPDYEADTKIFQSLTARLAAAGQAVTHPAAGEEYALGRGRITVLGPLRSYEGENDNSVVIRFTDGTSSVLIGGDAEHAAEEELAARWGRSLRSDILIVDHHGSASSSGEAFLKAVRPDHLILSCGAGNEYGHPHEAVMRRLKKLGAALFRTDLQGDITCFFTEQGILWTKEQTADFSAGSIK